MDKKTIKKVTESIIIVGIYQSILSELKKGNMPITNELKQLILMGLLKSNLKGDTA